MTWNLCDKTVGFVNHPHTGRAMEKLYRETLERDTCVSSLCYGLVVIWECQWEREVSSTRDIEAFLVVLFHCVYYVQQPTTPSFASAVRSIHSGPFFGLVECDISVPSHLVPHFFRWLPGLRMLRLDVSTSVSVRFVWPGRGTIFRCQVLCLLGS